MGDIDDYELRPELGPKLRLEALIARGSFGHVFRAHQLAVSRDVAVKVLRAELGPDTEPGRLFRDEIRAIGTIDHRNVVRIFDADEAPDGRLYFVMELLDGPTLQQLADHGPLPAARARALIAQLLDGLAAVHSSGHIHADVKPSNAIVVGSGDHERVVLIDFGLSRLRPADQPAEAVGGTRTYMAPEQLRSWSVDARSDVFSAALVLVKLLTGVHRNETELAPPLDAVEDPALRRLLERALAERPEDRPTAAELARGLRGGELGSGPFRELAPFTELDRGKLRGRDAEVARLVRRLEARSIVVLTAASGIGKTSLLRAGLLPALDARGISHRYIACDRAGAELGDDLPQALVLDQVEVALSANATAPIEAAIEAVTAGRTAVVLGVREDFVARLVSLSPSLAEGVPQLRLSPLERDGARAALVAPFAEHEITMADGLVDRLLDDLVRAGAQLELGEQSVFPPHLQLVGAALFDALLPGERALRLEHYERLGRLDGIVAGHLDRTLAELSASDREVARTLFLELVASDRTRVTRADHELLEVVGARFGHEAMRRVLERFALRRLVTRGTTSDGATSWTLVHDTLAPRIAAWLTVQDLDRRRCAELVRFHVRRSANGVPALLGRAELRELDRFAGLVEELETGHSSGGPGIWTPRVLVERSRQVVRYRRRLAAATATALIALGGLLLGSWLHERTLRERVSMLRDLNIGRVDLTLEPFDLRFDPTTRAVVRVPVDPTTLELSWRFVEPDGNDHASPGAPIAAPRLRHGIVSVDHRGAYERGIEVRGGDAFLVVTGRGRPGERCAASVIPIKQLPGNDHYVMPRVLRVTVPTCAATMLDTIAIPAGPFDAGGPGVPRGHIPPSQLEPEHVVDLPAFAIDRTEITNAAFAIFAELEDVHEIAAPEYPGDLAVASGPDYPRASLSWFDARAFCRFLGKDLPTSAQWQKALRGGLELATGPNPLPARNFPWGLSSASADSLSKIADATVTGDPRLGRANDPRRPAPVGETAGDRSPYGVVDLAGNLQEWTLDADRGTDEIPIARRPRITRGGNWWDTTPDALADYMVLENPRVPTLARLFIGARCVVRPP